MSALPSEIWERIVETGDATPLDGILADDVVFESPVVHTPQVGRAITKAYLLAALEALERAQFRFVARWSAERSAVLEFETRVDGLAVNGVDIIDWNADGKITRFKVMVRPLKAIDAVHQAMARVLMKK